MINRPYVAHVVANIMYDGSLDFKSFLMRYDTKKKGQPKNANPEITSTYPTPTSTGFERRKHADLVANVSIQKIERTVNKNMHRDEDFIRGMSEIRWRLKHLHPAPSGANW